MLAIFLDIETTGLNPRRHRAVEIALKIVDLETWDLRASYAQLIAQPLEVWAAADPASLQINGFSPKNTLGALSEEEVGQQISILFDQVGIDRSNAFFLCQNPSFDRSFFYQLIDVDLQEAKGWPYHWLDLASMYWIEVAAHQADKRLSKDSIARHFGLPAEARPHRAMQGVDHLILCYREVANLSLAASRPY